MPHNTGSEYARESTEIIFHFCELGSSRFISLHCFCSSLHSCSYSCFSFTSICFFVPGVILKNRFRVRDKRFLFADTKFALRGSCSPSQSLSIFSCVLSFFLWVRIFLPVSLSYAISSEFLSENPNLLWSQGKRELEKCFSKKFTLFHEDG